MTTIDESRQLPNGATWFRCALQVNPASYSKTYQGTNHGLDEAAYNAQLVAAAVQADISVIAVTDHNSVEAIERLAAVATEHGLAVFPGFEMESKEGIHTLCLFERRTSKTALDRCLGKLGIPEPGKHPQLSDLSFTDILECVEKLGGVVVGAHADEDKGLLTAIKGTARAELWKHPLLRAIAIRGTVDELGMDLRPIVRNQDPQYAREHPAADDLAIAVLNAADVKKPDDFTRPNTSTFVKMTEPSIDGLRQAFLDPVSRIRLHGEARDHHEIQLVAMSWEGGFLDGAAIHFNEGLNVLVGGRGTGKSTVVESLRYVLGLEPLGEVASDAHRGVWQKVLGSGTKVSLVVAIRDSSSAEYLIERTVPHAPVVRSLPTRTVLDVSPAALLPGIELYGQHELAELARMPARLPELLARFADGRQDRQTRRADGRRALERSRLELVQAEKDRVDLEQKLAALPGLEETLKRFRDAGIEDRLKTQSLLVREERIVADAQERVVRLRAEADRLAQAAQIDRAFVAPKALVDLPNANILAELDGALSQLSGKMQEAVTSLTASLATAASEVDAIRKRWEERREAARADYEKALRELQRERVDGAEFIEVRRRLEAMQPLTEQRSRLQVTLADGAIRREELLDEWEALEAQELRSLERAAKWVNRKLDGLVKVIVEPRADRTAIDQHLRALGGQWAQAIERFAEIEELSVRALAQVCAEFPEALSAWYKLAPVPAKALSQAALDWRLRLQEQELPPTIRVELNVAAEEQSLDFRRLDDLSKGQKATALLLILLLDSKAPLVIDQPEDDLDNRFVTEGVVPRLRETKATRQFVFATHNANIPVLGDAELVVGFEASGEAGKRGGARVIDEARGSIDASGVRSFLEKVLEGGRDAFERRRLKYGF